jgi:hypothetical protein
MKKILKNWIWYVPGTIIGGIAGFFYWKFFGCNGSCMITSNPVRTVIYFAVMGALINQMFQPSNITGKGAS